MKTTIIKLTVLAFLGCGLLSNCNTPAQKVENAQDGVAKAEADLNKANEEYLADIENYKKEAALKIEANNKSIADFNARMANEKAEAKADYKDKINAIEQKNSDLKKKMEGYQAQGKDQWDKFKTEFSRDMDELGTAFKNVTTSTNK